VETPNLEFLLRVQKAEAAASNERGASAFGQAWEEAKH